MPEKPPFLYIGVDFFGPVAVHQGRSYVKKYGRIITCMSSRSVHLEVSSCVNGRFILKSL